MKLDFEEATHTYRINGIEVPSVTQCLQLFDPFQNVDRSVLEAARQFGHHGHKAMALFLKDRLDWATLDPALVPYIEGGAEFMRLHADWLVVAVERMVASEQLGVAGTVDLVAEHNDHTYIVEWKFTSDQPWTAGPQTAAYARMYTAGQSARERSRVRRLCAVLRPGSFSTVALTGASDWNDFVSCLNVTKARWKHGIR